MRSSARAALSTALVVKKIHFQPQEQQQKKTNKKPKKYQTAVFTATKSKQNRIYKKKRFFDSKMKECKLKRKKKKVMSVWDRDRNMHKVIWHLSTGHKHTCNEIAVDAIRRDVSNAVFSQIIASGGVNLSNNHDLLRKAAEAYDLRFLRILLAAGATMDESEQCPSVLHAATTQGAFMLLAAQKGVGANAVDINGSTPLHHVCHRRWRLFGVKAMPLLVAAGANVSAKDKKGQTPLHIALDNKYDSNGDVFKALIVARSNVNAVDNQGVSVFLQFLRSKHRRSLALLRLLVSNGFNVNPVDRLKHGLGNTPLHHICDERQDEFTVEAVRLLLDAGADVSVRNENGATPLHSALSRCYGDTAAIVVTVKALIAAGSDVNAVNNKGTSVLELGASTINCLTIVRMLLDAGADARRGGVSLFDHAMQSNEDGRLLEMLAEAGADINAVDKDGNTACHSLANRGNIGLLVTTMVRLGAKVDEANERGETPMSKLLPRYVKPKACDIIALLDVGANANSTNVDGVSVCHFASRLGDLNLMELLINKYGANINCTTREGETPLMIAVGKDDIKMVSMLLAAGAKHDVVRCDDGATALHLAIGLSYIDIAKALIDAGANVNAFDARGWTPGHWACALRDEKLVDRLVNVGANVNVAAASGCTMLHLAARWRANGPVIGRLIAAGADLNAVNQQGQTVFHIAACNLSALTALLSGTNTAMLYREDNAGLTPLANAVIAGNEECLLAMVAAGATMNRIDRDGSTLLHLFVMHGNYHRRFVRTLVRLGIDVNALDNKGRSAADIAASSYSNQALLTTLIAVGAKFRKFEDISCWDAEKLSLIFASTDDGSKVRYLFRFHAALTTEPAVTDSSDVQKARAQLATARLRLVRARGAEICIGLQSLRLDALQLCEILLMACAPASTHVRFHELWNVAVKVKHFQIQKR
jgi:ankyrin repeat protein